MRVEKESREGVRGRERESREGVPVEKGVREEKERE